MTNNLQLKLFCVVDGESTPFLVKIESTETIGDLKEAIKTMKFKQLFEVDADHLTLWRVSIQEEDDENPILLDGIPDNEKQKLKATSKLSKIYGTELLDDTIHIIVQRPQPESSAHAHRAKDASPPASHPPLIVIPRDKIETELTSILKGVSHNHALSIIDPKKVEASQREKLRCFYKRPLPYHETAEDISLVMLGLELDKQAMTSKGETLRSIVEGDIGRRTGHRVVAMVAPSGSGKTATVIDLASKHFVIYTVCCIPGATVSPGFKDPNFIVLAEDIERMYRTVIRMNQGYSLGAVDIDSEVKDLAGERIKVEFLARLLFLKHLLDKNPNLEPRQFFRHQTTVFGDLAIELLVSALKQYEHDTIHAMLSQVQSKIQNVLLPRRLGVVIALDEAQVAANNILSGKLISPSALAENKRDLFDDKNQIQTEFRRGFLISLSATLCNLKATLVILGTALSLQNTDYVYPAVAKQTNEYKITNFPHFDQNDVSWILSDLVDMEGCSVPEAKRRKLSGRARFTIDVVNRLTKPLTPGDSKQMILENAIDSSVDNTMEPLRKAVRNILSNDQTSSMAHLLSRMVLAYHLKGGKISFAQKEQTDFVDQALCRLHLQPDGIYFIMDEPMVVEAVEEEFKVKGMDPVFIEYLDQIVQIIANFGVSSTSQGDAFEPLVRRSLQRFNGFSLVDLPFLQGIKLPTWCDNLTLQIDDINTANGLGYSAAGVRADLEFLTDRPQNKMLVPKSGTRPDGVWFFSDINYAGSLAIKLYGENISRSIQHSNETSSDIRRCFLNKDGVSVSKGLTDIQQEFVNSGTPSNLRGTLRIHIEIPGVSGGNSVSYVKRDDVANTEDVMVYINLSNMDSFFFEGISEHRDDIAKLKTLIRHIST